MTLKSYTLLIVITCTLLEDLMGLSRLPYNMVSTESHSRTKYVDLIMVDLDYMVTDGSNDK